MLLGMRLGTGIRALYELALLPERRSAVRELARKCEVTEPFLRRIFLDLRAHGYLDAQKGRVGGFRLVKEPHTIKIGDLAKILEKEPTLVLGRIRRDLLTPDPSCPTYQFWKNLEDKFMAEIEKLTLADVIALAGERSTSGRRSKPKGRSRGAKRSRR
ncbi:MAG: Rrf2 family transcriptional regulator [Candidatus Bipolaricaulota bacterium]|nr:Rrf2 family transcriptional regulator [Candidatus Bipolaricaulota bacterium]MDW8126634.1 Rrf2 family transcriptional regulator [Candidatus Bipolaricaulota bacterium]